MPIEGQDIVATTFTADALGGEARTIDPNANLETVVTTPVETVTTPSLESLQAQIESFKPINEYIAGYGDFDTAKPFLQMADQFSASEYQPDKMAKTMREIDQDRFSDLMWYAIDQSRPTIENWLLSDEGFKNKIYNADPDWQLFQNWKQSGGDVEELRLAGIDPNTPEGREFLRTRQENQRLRELDSQRSKAEEKFKSDRAIQDANQRVQEFIQEKDKWLFGLALNLKWGDEYKEDMIEVAQATQASVQQNVTIANKLKEALDLIAEGKKILASKAWNSAQTKIAEIFHQKATRRGNQINALRSGAAATRQQQQTRIEIPSKTGLSNTAGAASTEDTAGLTFEQKVARNLEKARIAGTLPASFK